MVMDFSIPVSCKVRANQALLRVARIDDHRLSVAPIVVALDFEGTHVPTVGRLRRLRDRTATRPRFDTSTGVLSRWTSTPFRVASYRKIDFADAGFEVVASVPSRPGDDSLQAQSYCDWTQFASELRHWMI